MVIDGATTTMLFLQLNLVAGTLLAFTDTRDDLAVLLNDVLTFKVSSVLHAAPKSLR